jgi:enolase
VPFFNVINGGKHAGLENDFQEHMIAPVGAKSFSEAVQMGGEVYGVLRGIVEKKFGHGARLLADEGGFAPPVGLKKRMDLLEKAVSESGYSKKVRLAVDCAASEFFKKGAYNIGGKKYSSGELIDFYESFAREYGIVSIEDGLAEDDWTNWRELVKAVSSRAQVVGDDFLVTNPERIRRAVSEKAATCLLLKPNQIGTVSEAVDAAGIAFEAGWGVMASHRSGESEDAFISDLAVGIGCGQCKFGAPARGERTAKYNQLLRIEEALGNKAGFSGRMFG